MGVLVALTSPPPFYDVGSDRVRHLCDAHEVYPAMLAALAEASHEAVLEIYWIGDDPAGERFRNALVACARRGVAVRVLYDAIGSLGLRPSW